VVLLFSVYKTVRVISFICMPKDETIPENSIRESFPKFYIEIRTRLASVLIVFVIGAIIGLINCRSIMLFTMSLVDLRGVNVVTTSPSQFIQLAINTSLFVGFLLALPLITYHLYNFSKPAMKRDEVEFVNKFVPLSVVLFIFGFLFGVWMSKFIFLIFAQMSKQFNVNNILDVEKLFSEIIFTGLLVGVVFQLPIFISMLTRFGLITYEQLRAKRKVVYGILIIIAVLLPPTDIVSLTLITIPLFALFELSLLLNAGSQTSTKGGV